MNTKALTRVEIKDVDRGEIAAVFSTCDVVDHDGDVTVKGAFEDGQPVAISAYGHASSYGTKPPVGKGSVRDLTTEAVMEGRFFLDTQDGHDTFTAVKELSEPDGPGQQWSYGYDVTDSEIGQFKGRRVRFLKGLWVSEVSPVLKGAGIDTRTLAAKAAKQPNSEIATALRDAGRERFGGEDVYVWAADYDLDESWVVYEISAADEAERLVRVSFERTDAGITLGSDESAVERTVGYAPKSGLTFSEHATSVLAGVNELVTRATEVMALRATKGKAISEGSKDLLVALDRDLKRLDDLIGEPAATPLSDDDAVREYLRFVAFSNGAT